LITVCHYGAKEGMNAVDPETLIALGGFASTLVAGLGGTFLGGWMERQAERRRQDVGIRQAARLIDSDLLTAETAARICVERKKWWTTDVRLSSEGWQQHRGDIASELPGEDWVKVIVAVQAVSDLQTSRDAALKVQRWQMATNPDTKEIVAAAEEFGIDIADPSPAISERNVEQIKPMLADLEAGRSALAALTQLGSRR
jgi:hypothetical protein